MIRRHTRWMRRTALLACLLGLAVIGGGYLAIGAAGEDKGGQDLTGKKAEPRERGEAAAAAEEAAGARRAARGGRHHR